MIDRVTTEFNRWIQRTCLHVDDIDDTSPFSLVSSNSEAIAFAPLRPHSCLPWLASLVLLSMRIL